jgi:hypothetical protein
MEENFNEEVKATKSINSNSLYYALIVSAAMIVYNILMWVMGLSLNKFISYPSYIILIVGMVMGTVAYRDKYNNRLLSYGKCFTSNFLIGLYASIIGAIWVYIFFNFIGTDLIPKILENAKEEIMNKTPSISDEQLQMQMSYVKKFTSPLMMVMWAFVGNTFFSAIFALIISAFVKKEEKSFA